MPPTSGLRPNALKRARSQSLRPNGLGGLGKIIEEPNSPAASPGAADRPNKRQRVLELDPDRPIQSHERDTARADAPAVNGRRNPIIQLEDPQRANVRYSTPPTSPSLLQPPHLLRSPDLLRSFSEIESAPPADDEKTRLETEERAKQQAKEIRRKNLEEERQGVQRQKSREGSLKENGERKKHEEFTRHQKETEVQKTRVQTQATRLSSSQASSKSGQNSPRVALWTPDDDVQLLQAKQQGLSFTQIVEKYFPNRTVESVRKRHARSVRQVKPINITATNSVDAENKDTVDTTRSLSPEIGLSRSPEAHRTPARSTSIHRKSSRTRTDSTDKTPSSILRRTSSTTAHYPSGQKQTSNGDDGLSSVPRSSQDPATVDADIEAQMPLPRRSVSFAEDGTSPSGQKPPIRPVITRASGRSS